MKYLLLLSLTVLLLVEIQPMQAEWVHQNSEQAEARTSKKGQRHKASKLKWRGPKGSQASQSVAGGVVLLVLASLSVFPLTAAFIGITFGPVPPIGLALLILGVLTVVLQFWGGIVLTQRRNSFPSQQERLRNASFFWGALSIGFFLCMLIVLLGLDFPALVTFSIFGLTSAIIWFRYGAQPLSRLGEKKEEEQ